MLPCETLVHGPHPAGPPLVAYLFGHYGYTSVFVYIAACWASVAILITAFGPRTKGRALALRTEPLGRSIERFEIYKTNPAKPLSIHELLFEEVLVVQTFLSGIKYKLSK